MWELPGCSVGRKTQDPIWSLQKQAETQMQVSKNTTRETPISSVILFAGDPDAACPWSEDLLK